MSSGVYTATFASSFSGTRELFEITAGTDQTVEILRLEVAAYTGTPADEQVRVTAGVVSVSGSGGALTELPLHPRYPTAGSAVTGNGAIGTLADVDMHWGFHLQAGLLYLPVPEERRRINGGDVYGFYMPNGPTASTAMACTLTWAEL